MEDALREGLRGRGVGVTEATWVAADTESTRMLPRTEATTALPPRARRRLEPIDEPTPPPRAPATAAARRAPAGPPPGARPSSRGIGRWIALLLVLAAIVAAVAVWQSGTFDGGNRSPQLRQDVSGRVDHAIDELRGLIEDNTR
jgi:hypothetical protein